LSDAAAAFAGLLIVAAVGFVGWRWDRYTRRAILPWTFSTVLDEATLRGTFEQSAASWGWRTIDSRPGRTTIRSTSPGQKQEMTITIEARGPGRNQVVVEATTVARTLGAPVKPHTIRVRMERFIAAASALDPSIRATRIGDGPLPWPFRVGAPRPW
jgi:hypothetical protein